MDTKTLKIISLKKENERLRTALKWAALALIETATRSIRAAAVLELPFRDDALKSADIALENAEMCVKTCEKES